MGIECGPEPGPRRYVAYCSQNSMFQIHQLEYKTTIVDEHARSVELSLEQETILKNFLNEHVRTEEPANSIWVERVILLLLAVLVFVCILASN